MKHRNLWLILTLLASLAVAGLIFFFSAQKAAVSDVTSAGIVERVLHALFRHFEEMPADTQASLRDAVTFAVRKLAHFCEYAVLGILMVRAWENCAGALVICSLYACTDEVHQYFVPGRAMQFRDVLIDSAGALFGIGLVALWRWRKRGERG